MQVLPGGLDFFTLLHRGTFAEYSCSIKQYWTGVLVNTGLANPGTHQEYLLPVNNRMQAKSLTESECVSVLVLKCNLEVIVFNNELICRGCADTQCVWIMIYVWACAFTGCLNVLFLRKRTSVQFSLVLSLSHMRTHAHKFCQLTMGHIRLFFHCKPVSFLSLLFKEILSMSKCTNICRI